MTQITSPEIEAILAKLVDDPFAIGEVKKVLARRPAKAPSLPRTPFPTYSIDDDDDLFDNVPV